VGRRDSLLGFLGETLPDELFQLRRNLDAGAGQRRWFLVVAGRRLASAFLVHAEIRRGAAAQTVPGLEWSVSGSRRGRKRRTAHGSDNSM
jgi:hypothetical protein